MLPFMLLAVDTFKPPDSGLHSLVCKNVATLKDADADSESEGSQLKVLKI